MTNRNDFLKALTVKAESIKLENLNNMEIIIREPNINESIALEETRKKVLLGEKTDKDLIIEACRYSMVEPAFFTDEEIKNLNTTAINVMNEIYMKIPTIGMTDEQKKDYEKRLVESLNNHVKKMLTKEEEEKK